MAVRGGLPNSCEKKRNKKQRRKGKIYPFECRVSKNSKDRSPSSVINAKKQRKTIEWARLEISSRKLEIPREGIFVFHPKMGTIKDRNGMDLTEAEDIRKRCQEYAEELYKKDLHNADNHDGMITHLEIGQRKSNI